MRNLVISGVVIIWLAAFHYESTRHFYLEPLFKRELPKIKFLFPPAGWIMFFNVDDAFGMAEVYGIKDGQPRLIEPHRILRTRAIGYDNIKRNALVGVLSSGMREPFCAFLKRKFPYFDHFVVTYVEYPSLTTAPFRQEQRIVYECR